MPWPAVAVVVLMAWGIVTLVIDEIRESRRPPRVVMNRQRLERLRLSVVDPEAAAVRVVTPDQASTAQKPVDGLV